jgi:low affinity Fe/Cu permease
MKSSLRGSNQSGRLRELLRARRGDCLHKRHVGSDRAALTNWKQQGSGIFSRVFGDVANKTSQAAGRASTFILAAGVILVWAITGPMFGYSDTWQLVINTGTTIVTFLLVFLIQNSQNRDSAAIQVKLDELIRVGAARNSLVGIEHLTDEELEDLRTRCEARAKAEKAGEQTVKETIRKGKERPCGRPAKMPRTVKSRRPLRKLATTRKPSCCSKKKISRSLHPPPHLSCIWMVHDFFVAAELMSCGAAVAQQQAPTLLLKRPELSSSPVNRAIHPLDRAGNITGLLGRLAPARHPVRH